MKLPSPRMERDAKMNKVTPPTQEFAAAFLSLLGEEEL